MSNRVFIVSSCFYCPMRAVFPDSGGHYVICRYTDLVAMTPKDRKVPIPDWCPLDKEGES